MFTSNRLIHEKGKVEFSERFKMQLKENRNWEVDVVWELTDNHDETDSTSFTVHVHASCILTLPNEMIEEFGLEAKGIEAMKCQEMLNKKERELAKKISIRA